METKLKSLANIAAELGLSKQAVYKRVNSSPDIVERLKPHTVTSGTRKYYTLQGQAFIKSLFASHQSQPEVNQRSTGSQPEETTDNSENTTNAIEESQPKVNQRSTISQPEVNQKSTFSQPEVNLKSTESQPKGTAFDMAIEALTAQLNAKDEQLKAAQDNIKDLNKHIEELTAALRTTQEQLTAAQALHAGTLQKQLTAEHEEQAHPESDELTAPEDLTPEAEQKTSIFTRLFKRSKKQR